MKLIISTTTVLLLSFVGTAAAAAGIQEAVPDRTIGELVGPVLEALAGGAYWQAAALALVLAVAAARRWLAPRYPWLASGDVAPFLVLLGAFGSALAGTLAGGAEMSAEVAWSALKIAIAAAGGYSLLRRPLGRVLAWAESRWPWARVVTGPLLWILNRPTATEKAEAAGAAAVKDAPAPGITHVTGDPRDVR